MIALKMAAAAACALLVAAQPVLAQQQQGFTLGTELYEYDYREFVDGEVVVRDDGRFAGLNAGYTHVFRGEWFLRGLVSVARGSVDYASEDGALRGIRQGVARLQVEPGRDFILANGSTLSLFTGLNARMLRDSSGGLVTELGYLGFDRDIFYLYSPVGFELGFPLRGTTRLAVGARYNHLIDGDVESKLSRIDPEVSDLRFALREGSGWELQASAAFQVGTRARLSIGPYVRGWRIGQSREILIVNPDDSSEGMVLFEPRNRTREAGIRMSVGF